jgi:hypothetical protein
VANTFMGRYSGQPFICSMHCQSNLDQELIYCRDWNFGQRSSENLPKATYATAVNYFLLRLREASSRAVTPSLSLMSAEAPCWTSHFSSAGSYSFSIP